MTTSSREMQKYADAWRRLRFIENTFWGVLVVGILILFVLSFPSFRGVEKAFGFCLFIALVGLNSIASSFRCPRCGEKFYKSNFLAVNSAAKVCLHCGLPKWESYPSEKSKE
jgi:predicted RNA-binding Zn-ribbon protein involved in translation (DUF1610 family)